ncbi:hypothetical protein [Microcystis phage Mwe-JY13]
MTQYPEDVVIAARNAAAKEWAELGPYLEREFLSGMRDDSGSVRSAIHAILAERERCASVCRVRIDLYDTDQAKNAVRECASSIEG